MIQGIGHGKLLLFGEHAAVFGYPAVGLSLPLGTSVTVNALATGRSPDRSVDNGTQNDPEQIEEVHALFEDAIALVSQAAKGSMPPAPRAAPQIRVQSEIPMSVGLGSSAALTVAVARAAASSVGVSLSDYEIWAVAHQLEKRYHGTPSGIDTGLAALDGTYAFRRDSGALHGTGELPKAALLRTPVVSIVVAALPRQSSTMELVAEVRRRRESDDGRTDRALQHLGSIAGKAAGLLTADNSGRDAESIGSLANQAQQNLRAIGVSSDTVEYTVQRLVEAGATGAKLSGAGGGGAVFGVFASELSGAEGRAAAQEEKDVQAWLFGLDARGVHVC